MSSWILTFVLSLPGSPTSRLRWLTLLKWEVSCWFKSLLPRVPVLKSCSLACDAIRKVINLWEADPVKRIGSLGVGVGWGEILWGGIESSAPFLSWLLAELSPHATCCSLDIQSCYRVKVSGSIDHGLQHLRLWLKPFFEVAYLSYFVTVTEKKQANIRPPAAIRTTCSSCMKRFLRWAWHAF